MRAGPKQYASAQGARLLMVNADDWGRDRATTDRTLDCVRCGSVTSVSAMVFMEDSHRAATVALEHTIDTGLHINLTSAFSEKGCAEKLLEYQSKIARYLLCHRLAQAVFHPGLMVEFDYVVKSQIDEFERLYGHAPIRIDGHHHMHLCANVLFQCLLPGNTMVRRNFSLEPGEKSVWNRAYRACIDAILARRHRLPEYFFSIVPIKPDSRLLKILSLAHGHVVEVEVHPINRDEYEFLLDGGFARLTNDLGIRSSSAFERLHCNGWKL